MPLRGGQFNIETPLDHLGPDTDLETALRRTRPSAAYKTPEMRLGDNLALGAEFKIAPFDRVEGLPKSPKAQIDYLRRAKNNKNPFSEPKGNYAGLKLRGTFEENNNPEESLSEKLTRYLDENN